MDEAEYCDRIAIMDQGRIIVLDSPAALKASVGTDRVQIQTPDNDAAIAVLRERFELEATVAEGAVTFGVPEGEQFVPRLFAELAPADPGRLRLAAVPRRRLHVLHRHHDPRRRGHLHRPHAQRRAHDGPLMGAPTPTAPPAADTVERRSR